MASADGYDLFRLAFGQPPFQGPAGPFSLITSSVSPSGCHLPQRGRQVHWTVFRALEPPEGEGLCMSVVGAPMRRPPSTDRFTLTRRAAHRRPYMCVGPDAMNGVPTDYPRGSGYSCSLFPVPSN